MNGDTSIPIPTRLAAGDQSAFSEVYDQFWESLFKYVIRILPDRDEAADTVQEAFIALWEARSNLKGVRSVKAYLFAIARNRAFKRFRANLGSKEAMERFIAFHSEVDESGEKEIEARNLLATIDEEINKLPPRMKDVFILSRKEHLSYQEIAERLKISDLTVKKQISNSLRYLRLKMRNGTFLVIL